MFNSIAKIDKISDLFLSKFFRIFGILNKLIIVKKTYFYQSPK